MVDSTVEVKRYDCKEPECPYETDDLSKLKGHYFRVHGVGNMEIPEKVREYES